MSDSDQKRTVPMKHGDLCHVEIPVQDKERAKGFYGEVFGWQFQEVPEMEYTLFQTPSGADGVGGGLFSPSEHMPAKVIDYMLVDSIDETASKVEAHGGKKAGPKIEIGDHGWLMHIEDSEGNLVAMWQSKK